MSKHLADLSKTEKLALYHKAKKRIQRFIDTGKAHRVSQHEEASSFKFPMFKYRVKGDEFMIFKLHHDRLLKYTEKELNKERSSKAQNEVQ